ncbi:MAG TPA: spermidine synthase [Methylibium sp.]|uniref:spermidine synthase n=1 Tax=Methylibium sp. TaxID=2067992 RepID=UPI002DB70D0D|nr:spermidine synthase [Methylibium sp.]HEU4458787.1 spermidine synthase [Methylibium sp.]
MSAKPRRQTLAAATVAESDGVRTLHLGTPWVQGAMRIGKPQAIELEYVQRMMAWLLLVPLEPKRLAPHAVQLGLGAGAITKFCHRQLRWRCTAVELNPTVIGACRLWFKLPPDDARLAVVEADAGAWVADPRHARSADALCVDLYDHHAAAPVLDDESFYAGCHAVLADGGAMSVNLFGRDVSFGRSAERIARVFGPQRVAMLRPTREGNTIVLAWKGEALPARDELARRAEAIERGLGLPARKWLKLLQNRPTPTPTAA